MGENCLRLFDVRVFCSSLAEQPIVLKLLIKTLKLSRLFLVHHNERLAVRTRLLAEVSMRKTLEQGMDKKREGIRSDLQVVFGASQLRSAVTTTA
jgi:hypothetical protein